MQIEEFKMFFPDFNEKRPLYHINQDICENQKNQSTFYIILWLVLHTIGIEIIVKKQRFENNRDTIQTQ
jgi:hypothetical protein